MYEIEIQKGVAVSVDGDTVRIKGKLGSCSKKFNKRLISISSNGSKIKVEETSNGKLSDAIRLVNFIVISSPYLLPSDLPSRHLSVMQVSFLKKEHDAELLKHQV